MSFSPVLCFWYLILSPENTPLCGAAHSNCSFCFCVCFSYLQKSIIWQWKPFFPIVTTSVRRRILDRNALLWLFFFHILFVLCFCSVLLQVLEMCLASFSSSADFFFLTFQVIYFCLNQNIWKNKIKSKHLNLNCHIKKSRIFSVVANRIFFRNCCCLCIEKYWSWISRQNSVLRHCCTSAVSFVGWRANKPNCGAAR